PRGEPGDKTFAETYRILKPGGLFLLRAPAYQWLRSWHDEQVNASYRYTARELKRRLTEAGFSLARVTYANTLAFPAALVARVAQKIGLAGHSDSSDIRHGSSWMENLLGTFLRWEARYLSNGHRRFPFGLSVFVVARK